MGALFHNYKNLLKLNTKSKFSEDSLMKKVAAMKGEKPLAKVLFDKTCKRWSGLLYALHKDDRERLLRMLIDCCYSVKEGAAKTIIGEDSNHNLSLYFFFCHILQNQKLINRIKKSIEVNVKTDIDLLDSID